MTFRSSPQPESQSSFSRRKGSTRTRGFEASSAPSGEFQRQLEILVAIGDTLSLTAAAEKLGVSQPSVSETLRRVEGELGCKLVDRTTRQLALTYEGQHVVASAREAMRSLAGTFEAIAVLYDNLLEFKKIPDPNQPGAFREDTADHPDLPAGLAIQGKLAESFELDPGGKFIRFHLRQGIKSNWGNELTAEDVKWTWDRKFALGALGAFFLSTLGLENKDGVKVEGKYTVSINLDDPNPLLAKLQPNLYNPIYDSTKCKQESNADDPWARKFLENNSAGFGPYRLDQLQRGQQAVFNARDDYYRGKPTMDTVIFREVPTSATRASLLQGGAVDIAQYLQPLEIIKLRCEKGVAVDPLVGRQTQQIELHVLLVKPGYPVRLKGAPRGQETALSHERNRDQIKFDARDFHAAS